MSKNIRFYFQHGWAHVKEDWDEWKPRITPYGKGIFLDRGYFSNAPPEMVTPPTETESIVLITHSFGLHLLPQYLFSHASLVVIIGGFATFHPSEASANKRSKRILDRMLKNLSSNPQQVLKEFFHNSYSPLPSPNIELLDRPNISRLLSDLRDLDQQMFKLKLLENIPKIIILHGQQDQIIPMTKGLDLQNKLTNCKVNIISNAGHALPFTHIEECWAIVKEEFF